MNNYLVHGATFVYDIIEKANGKKDRKLVSKTAVDKAYEIDAENATEAIRLAAVEALEGIAPAEDIHRDEEMSNKAQGHGSCYTERNGQAHVFDAFVYVLATEE